MAEREDITIARELGVIATTLKVQGEQLARIESHALATNGRVKQHDIDIAVLKDRDERDAEHSLQFREQLKDLQGRPRTWALGIGGPVIAAAIGVLLAHGI